MGFIMSLLLLLLLLLYYCYFIIITLLLLLIWVVVWNMNFMTFHSVGNVIIPTDEHIFQRGRLPPTSNGD